MNLLGSGVKLGDEYLNIKLIYKTYTNCYYIQFEI